MAYYGYPVTDLDDGEDERREDSDRDSYRAEDADLGDEVATAGAAAPASGAGGGGVASAVTQGAAAGAAAAATMRLAPAVLRRVKHRRGGRRHPVFRPRSTAVLFLD